MEQRTCEACGRTFTPTMSTQRVCPPSDADRARAARTGGQPRSACARRVNNAAYRMPRVKAICAHCGNPFLRPRREGRASRLGRHVKRYCSLDCQYAARSNEYRRRDDIAPPPARRLTDDECAERAAERLFVRLLAPPNRADVARYKQALRHDPCAYCGASSEAIDHIDPTSDAGERADWQNMTGACRLCNSAKGRLPLLLALPWIPLNRDYHAMRRSLFAATGAPRRLTEGVGQKVGDDPA